jgi:hypothetical protein
MKKTSNVKRKLSAEAIARLADKGNDVSSYFTNKGGMIRPVPNKALSKNVVGIENYRKCILQMMDGLESKDLVYEFFFVFSRLEHALMASYRKPNGGVAADWDKFAKDINEKFLENVSPEVEKAIKYFEDAPPKKQVIANGSLIWKTEEPQNDPQLQKLLEWIRRVRNNLFHGEKLQTLVEGDSKRDRDLLWHGLIILYACVGNHRDVENSFLR